MIVIVQQAYPNYRHAFFMKLSEFYQDNFNLYYSVDQSLISQLTPIANSVNVGSITKLLGKFKWQSNILSIKLSKHDIVVVSGDYHYLSNLLLLIKCKLLSVKVIVWTQFYSSSSNSLLAKYRMKLSSLANGILFYYHEEAIKFRGNKSCSLFYLNNSIDSTEITCLREKYIPSQRKNRIVYIGRLTHKSNILLLIRSISLMPTLCLDIIGAGPLLEEAKTLTLDLDLSDRISFLGEISDEKSISSVMNNALFFVYPGSVGLSLLHAMAYGLPVVIHDNEKSHMPEYFVFKNSMNGLVFKYNDIHSLANVCTQLSRDFPSLSKFSQNNIDLVTQKYNVDSMAQNFISCVNTVVND